MRESLHQYQLGDQIEQKFHVQHYQKTVLSVPRARYRISCFSIKVSAPTIWQSNSNSMPHCITHDSPLPWRHGTRRRNWQKKKSSPQTPVSSLGTHRLRHFSDYHHVHCRRLAPRRQDNSLHSCWHIYVIKDTSFYFFQSMKKVSRKIGKEVEKRTLVVRFHIYRIHKSIKKHSYNFAIQTYTKNKNVLSYIFFQTSPIYLIASILIPK